MKKEIAVLKLHDNGAKLFIMIDSATVKGIAMPYDCSIILQCFVCECLLFLVFLVPFANKQIKNIYVRKNSGFL